MELGFGGWSGLRVQGFKGFFRASRMLSRVEGFSFFFIKSFFGITFFLWFRI